MAKQILLRKALHNIIDAMDKGLIDCSDEDIDTALSVLNGIGKDKTPMSKEVVCNYLHMTRSTFDRKVCEGALPPGRKIAGFKELIWYKSDFEKK